MQYSRTVKRHQLLSKYCGYADDCGPGDLKSVTFSAVAAEGNMGEELILKNVECTGRILGEGAFGRVEEVLKMFDRILILRSTV